MPVLPVPLELDAIEFIQARHYKPISGPQRPVDLIVIHDMEHAEKPGTARAVAKWFAGPNAPQASAHYCIDAEEVIQCVRLQDVAWAAPGANRDGVHLELPGYARQTAAEWDDDYSRSVLWLASQVTALLCQRFGVPLLRVDPTPGARGLCGHVDVTNWRNGGHGHTDPGKNFPWRQFVAMVDQFVGSRPTDPAPAPEALRDEPTVPGRKIGA